MSEPFAIVEVVEAGGVTVEVAAPVPGLLLPPWPTAPGEYVFTVTVPGGVPAWRSVASFAPPAVPPPPPPVYAASLDFALAANSQYLPALEEWFA